MPRLWRYGNVLGFSVAKPMEAFLRKKLTAGKFQNLTQKRSRMMSQVRSRGNKTTEARLRYSMVSAGMSGWRMHPRTILGRPDFFFEKARLAVFVDGCFWHACEACGHVPFNNRKYWHHKLLRNRERDRSTSQRLRRSGYKVLRFWEHQTTTEMTGAIRSALSAKPAAVKGRRSKSNRKR